jgi:hypothetical protein
MIGAASEGNAGGGHLRVSLARHLVSSHRTIQAIRVSSRLAQFGQAAAGRPDVAENADQGGPIFDKTDEHGGVATRPILRPDVVSPRRGNLLICPHRRSCYFGDVHERPVERSRSSRARRTAEDRSCAPSLE